MGTAGGLDKAGAGGAKLTPHTRTGGAHTPKTRPPLAAPQCSDYRQVAPRSKRSSDLFESSNKSRVVGLVCLKVLDLAVHLYTVAVSSFSLHLAVANLHQVTGETHPCEMMTMQKMQNCIQNMQSSIKFFILPKYFFKIISRPIKHNFGNHEFAL